MIEEIEPHPDLIEYFNITQNFTSNLTVDIFTNVGENYNILSDINKNIFLLKRLDELNLLKEENHIIDCGIGLGNTLFEIYLQSKEIDKKFYFKGVEKQKVYIRFILDNLSHLWKDALSLENNDIMNIDYSNFNIVYSYSPFNNHKQLKLMYQKIISEIKPESIIIEHANKGLGHFNLLEEFNDLEKINLDHLYIFKKL
jgi:hypothetical protein